ncbi:MAG TPA: hypothetical protein VHO03_17115 [Ignavibacteriales bacterium]|nr:hypothetical protein [Ignavibacteriales bacterium]
MKTIKFNLNRFCFDHRLTLPELSAKTNIPYQTVWGMMRRESVKLSFIKILESHFGDCSRYIIKGKNKNPRKVA